VQTSRWYNSCKNNNFVKTVVKTYKNLTHHQYKKCKYKYIAIVCGEGELKD